MSLRQIVASGANSFDGLQPQGSVDDVECLSHRMCGASGDGLDHLLKRTEKRRMDASESPRKDKTH